MFFRLRLCALPVQVGAGHDVEDRKGLSRLEVDSADIAASDDADFDRLHDGWLSFFEEVSGAACSIRVPGSVFCGPFAIRNLSSSPIAPISHSPSRCVMTL